MKVLKRILLAVLTLLNASLILASLYEYGRNGDIRTIVTCVTMTMVTIAVSLPLLDKGSWKS